MWEYIVLDRISDPRKEETLGETPSGNLHVSALYSPAISPLIE